MESYLEGNFGGVQAKHSSDEALRRWRKLVGVIKSPKHRFRFPANFDKRSEATAMKRNNLVEEPLLLGQRLSESGGDGDSQSGVEMDPLEANRTGISQSRIAEPGRDNLSEPTTGDIEDPEAGHGHPPSSTANDQSEQRKRRVKYSVRAFLFVASMLGAYYAGSASSSNLFHVAFAVYCAAFLATMVPRLGSAMVYVSSFLLVLGSYFLLLTSNKKKLYAYAIVPTPLPIIAALAARYKRRTGSGSGGEAANDQKLDEILEWSGNVANGGGFISFALGRFMGPSQHATAATAVVGFLFFFTVALGIYLMAVTTVRTAALIAHATHLHKLLLVLIVATIITAFIVIVFHQKS